MLPGRWVAVGAYWLLIAAAAAGTWILQRERGTLSLLLAPAALAVLTSLAAFGYPRFRYAADLAFLVLAAVAMERVAALAPSAYAAFRRRSVRSRV